MTVTLRSGTSESMSWLACSCSYTWSLRSRGTAWMQPRPSMRGTRKEAWHKREFPCPVLQGPGSLQNLVLAFLIREVLTLTPSIPLSHPGPVIFLDWFSEWPYPWELRNWPWAEPLGSKEHHRSVSTEEEEREENQDVIWPKHEPAGSRGLTPWGEQCLALCWRRPSSFADIWVNLKRMGFVFISVYHPRHTFLHF